MTNPKVLYVEDSAVVGQFLVDALSFEGVDAVLAEHAERALEILGSDADSFALVLCDQSLPDTSGLELMRIIRERYPTLRLVLTTGFAGSEIETAAGEFDGLLPKPFDARDVVALLG